MYTLVNNHYHGFLLNGAISLSYVSVEVLEISLNEIRSISLVQLLLPSRPLINRELRRARNSQKHTPMLKNFTPVDADLSMFILLKCILIDFK